MSVQALQGREGDPFSGGDYLTGNIQHVVAIIQGI